MLNIAAIMGRLVADPELRHTPSGVSVCSFTVAVDRSFSKAGEPRKADFIDVVAWRGSAEFVCKYFRKGSPIALDGAITTETYQDKNGGNRKRTAIVASNIHFAGQKAHPGGAGHDSDEGGEAGPAPAAPAYAPGANDDFIELGDSDDLPF